MQLSLFDVPTIIAPQQIIRLNTVAKSKVKSRRGEKEKKVKLKFSDQWYTPNTKKQPVLNLVAKGLGGTIDLDPCANEEKTVPANLHFTQKENGLSKQWFGNGYVNPPYSSPKHWLQHLVNEMEAGRLLKTIALLKSGCINNIGTGGIIKAHAKVACHWQESSRIKFIPGKDLWLEREEHELGPPKSPNFDTVLVYFGDNPVLFAETFYQYGAISWFWHPT